MLWCGTGPKYEVQDKLCCSESSDKGHASPPASSPAPSPVSPPHHPPSVTHLYGLWCLPLALAGGIGPSGSFAVSFQAFACSGALILLPQFPWRSTAPGWLLLRAGHGTWAMLRDEWGGRMFRHTLASHCFVPTSACPDPVCSAGDRIWNTKAHWRCWCKAVHSFVPTLRKDKVFPPRGSACAWENASPRTASAGPQPPPSAFPSRCFLGVKLKFCRTRASLPMTKSIKKSKRFPCACVSWEGYVNIACLYYPIWKDISFYQLLLHNLNNWNLFKGSLLQENALHLGF